MVDKKLSQFDEVSTGDVSYFPVLDENTKNGKLAATKAMPWTNCITDIPQDIKLSLNNGTLTLVAGSKVYIPNGSGVFDEVVIESDVSWGSSSTSWSGTKWLVRRPDGTLFVNNGDYTSGSTYSGGTYGIWYDTTNNLVKYTSNGGSTWISGYSLPLAQITVASGTGAKSIDQVFNGLGYIGSTVFALPGVKGLIPNGRNEDGTLNNTTSVLSSVSIYTPSPITNNYRYSLAFRGAVSIFYNNLVYNEEENKNYAGGTYSSWLDAGYLYFSDNKISELKVKTVFHAVDYSEFKEVKDDMMTLSTSQTVSGGKTYTGENVFYGGGRCRFFQTNIDISTIPATTQYGGAIQLRDKNGQNIGYIDSAQFTQGQIYARIGVVMNTSGGATIYPYLNVCGSLSGSQWVEVPTPSSVEDNSNKAITTQWFNNKIQVVSALPANPVNGVFYFITD